jgi:hypothetical protein
MRSLTAAVILVGALLGTTACAGTSGRIYIRS